MKMRAGRALLRRRLARQTLARRPQALRGAGLV